jgi:dienelactone hydrolase
LRRNFALPLFAALLAFAIFAQDAHAAVQRISTSYRYQGKTIRVEIYRPIGSHAVPGALVLHGASGLGRGWFVYPFAKAMAERGVAAAVVHYYDGLGKRKGKASPRIFRTREKIVKSALDFMARRKDVKSDALGVYGMSLGGFHALALGVADKRVRAVVSLGGGLSGHIPKSAVRNLPPTLIVHGSRDRVVPFKRALAVSKAIEKVGGPVQMKVYRGVGHSLSSKTHKDAVNTIARFMAKTLRAKRMVAEAPRR